MEIVLKVKTQWKKYKTNGHDLEIHELLENCSCASPPHTLDNELKFLQLRVLKRRKRISLEADVNS